MILVILAISLIILGTGISIYVKYGKKFYYNDKEFIYYLLNVVGGVLTSISLIATLILSVHLSGRLTINEKISMYESENKSIETSISTIVENYKDYEKEIFKNVKQDSYVTIAMQMYPELKSNDLVKNQIDVYTKNNEKIKSLKLEKINYKPIAWWLYFGE